MTDTPRDTGAAQFAGAVSTDRLMENLRVIATRVKLSGSAEELESFRFLEARMQEYGYRTTLISHPAYISLPGAARVEVDGGVLACITQSFSHPSPAGGLQGELVYAGDGSAAAFAAADVRGRIALLEGMARPPAALQASRAGAAGVVHISPDEEIHQMCISPVWGSPSAETRASLPTPVVVTVSRQDGAALRARVQAGEAVRVTLHAEVDTGWRQTPILVAELAAPGAGPEDPFVLFSGHHDTWFAGVMDNGAANATMLEVARLVAGRREALKRGMRFCFWSGHSHGRYSGSAWYADAFWDELDRRCVAHVNADFTGGRGADDLTATGVSTELWALAREVIGAQAGQAYGGRRSGRFADQSFFGIGLPALFASLSYQPIGPDPLLRHLRLGWWWHTEHDTLDKIDPAALARDTRVFAHAVWRLLTADVLPFDYAEQARALGAELGRIAASLGERLPLEGLLRRAALLEREAVRAQGATAPAERINAALMRVGRALVPLDYTRGDRFTHDPALDLPVWPVLQPLRDLAALPDRSEDLPFQTVSARRAANRMAFALREAVAALQSI